MGSLIVRFTRISPTHHRFQYIRPDGSGETTEFETKSVLFHDLLHFAVENEAHLADSFYGLLIKGRTFAQLVGKDPAREPMAMNAEIVMTERIVGGLTNVVRRDLDPQPLFAGMKNLLDAYGEAVPDWLTSEFVMRVKEHMRRLVGMWNATPFGMSLELRFSLAPTSPAV